MSLLCARPPVKPGLPFPVCHNGPGFLIVLLAIAAAPWYAWLLQIPVPKEVVQLRALAWACAILKRMPINWGP